LTAELAAAAIPSSILVLPELPGTANGKLDRAAFPLPASPPDGPETSGGSPSTSEVERLLREVWSAVLGVPEVGPDDDFFGLGGNSLGMLQISARVRQLGGYEIPLRQFFRHSTVSSPRRVLEGGSADSV
jgi:aryl carrier-like protein